MTRKYCDELITALKVVQKGFEAPLLEISQNHLNHKFAAHKMTIGQIAIHCASWAQYFMAPIDNKPWEKAKWTCKPIEYPITIEIINQTMIDGFQALYDKLMKIDDQGLEITQAGDKGPGYIIYRLLLHFLAHSNQMSYLRSLLDPSWEFGSHFGDMTTTLINISYHTTRDIKIGGF